MPPTALNVIFKTTDGQEVATMLVSAKQFKTGSRGLFAQGKIEIDGVRYQTQIQLVEIGSKGRTEGETSGEEVRG
jgi:hypothetical protein